MEEESPGDRWKADGQRRRAMSEWAATCRVDATTEVRPHDGLVGTLAVTEGGTSLTTDGVRPGVKLALKAENGCRATLLDSEDSFATPSRSNHKRRELFNRRGAFGHPVAGCELDSGFLSRIRAWMVVPAVDFAMVAAPMAWRPPQIWATLAMAVLATLLLTGGSRYIAPLHLSVLDELPHIVTRLLTAAATISTWILFVHHRPELLTFFETACQSIGLVIVGRIVITRVIRISRSRGTTKHQNILIGGGPVAAELARIVAKHPEYGQHFAGFVDDAETCHAELYLPRLGRLLDLDAAVVTTGADTLLVADGGFEERALMDAVRTKHCRDTHLFVVPRIHEFHTMTGQADHIGSIPIMRIRNPDAYGPSRLVKRAFDITCALMSLVVLLPVLVVAAMAVRIEGGPGVIFRQTRVGQRGKLFEVLKFRSMRPVDESESRTQWSVATDNRVGPVGRFLRRTSIDELPQLWNILRGDMTVVGPRPERPHFVEQFSTQFDRYAYRHRVQVGLTGLAQVSGLRGDTSIVDRARYDNYYIENWSLWLDVTIILRTFREVLFCRGR